ncbi:hypothetical protein TgHK011_001479 [Trichoderma gracile]|nr:hypothetical protein TgHK011_001479 [Trichoderma gracile]
MMPSGSAAPLEPDPANRHQLPLKKLGITERSVGCSSLGRTEIHRPQQDYRASLDQSVLAACESAMMGPLDETSSPPL